MEALPIGQGLKLDIAVPFLGKFRPFVGRCCQKCTPKSWESLFHKHLASLGFCNVIKITEENTRYRGWLVRRLCLWLAVCEWKLPAEPRQALRQRIFRNERVQAFVSCKGQGDAPATEKSVEQWMREIQRILTQIQASLSPFLLRLSLWALLKLLGGAFLRVVAHRGQLEAVRRAVQAPDAPVVFLATHESQLDGPLLQLLLVSRGLPLPRVAWEHRAVGPKFRALLTRLGGVCLPQEGSLPLGHEQGALARAVLASYVEELLRNKEPLLIFLEEAFSGVRQLSTLGREWLSLVVAAFQAGAVPDVTVVPLGISYDRVPDLIYRGQVTTQSGWAWLSLFRAACRGFGCVRVDFAQPFSLQEYSESNFCRPNCSRKRLEEVLLPGVLGKRTLDRDALEQQWFLGLQRVAAPDVEAGLVDSVSLHSLSEETCACEAPAFLRHILCFLKAKAGVSCSAITAVPIMSALLLHKHQKGVFLSRLMQDFVWLTEEVLLRNFDVGFAGRVWDVVQHALLLLQPCLRLHCLSVGDILVTPEKTEAAVAELSWHSAALLPVFLPEAVGACAVSAILVELLPFLGSPEQLRDVLVVQQELHSKTLLLVQLLPKDFLLCQPCQSVYSYCQVVVDKLIQCGVLVAEEVPSERSACDAAQKGSTGRLLWKASEDFGDSESDCSGEAERRCFRISQLENCCQLFAFLCCLLSPLLKALGRAADFLGDLERPQPESQYLEKLHQFLLRRAAEDASFECASRALASVAVRIYKNLGVLREDVVPTDPILHLSEEFTDQENREKLQKFIEQFIYS